MQGYVPYLEAQHIFSDSPSLQTQMDPSFRGSRGYEVTTLRGTFLRKQLLAGHLPNLHSAQR